MWAGGAVDLGRASVDLKGTCSVGPGTVDRGSQSDPAGLGTAAALVYAAAELPAPGRQPDPDSGSSGAPMRRLWGGGSPTRKTHNTDMG